MIDTSRSPVPVPGDQQHPAVACDGENLLVVWQDDRCVSSDIYGARVSPAGAVLDPQGIAISTALGGQAVPDVAFDGENFLAVWEDSRGAWPCIYGARVTQAGVVLDPQGIAVSTVTGGQGSPALAFDGENYLVVWQDGRYGPVDIYGARVTPAGVVLDPQGIVISAANGGQTHPAVASDGDSYLVAWEDARNGAHKIYGARVTPAGEVLDTTGIAISSTTGYREYPAIAFDSENFLVVWHDARNGVFLDIYGARVTPAGVVLDTAGIAISTAMGYQWTPAIAFDGVDYLVAWEDWRSFRDIYGARVTPAGVVLDTAGIAISTTSGGEVAPAFAFDGENHLVVWGDYRNSSGDIYGARVTPAAVALDSAGIAISTAPQSQYDPALAFDGDNFLVIWEDRRIDDSTDIYGARVTPAGVVLDTAAIAISSAVGSQLSSALASDGDRFLAVWQDDRAGIHETDVYGARLTPAGVVLDTAGIAISTAADRQWSPALASDGENFLVVWQDRRSSTYDYDIYAARVTTGGAVLDTAGLAVSTATNDQLSPVAAFDGNNFLVVWTDVRYSRPCIYGARVTPSGVVLDPVGILIAIAPGGQESPTLAFDGENFLVAWRDSRHGDSAAIYGARVTPLGVVLDPAGLAISTAVGGQEAPTLAFDGENFMAVWQESRGGDSTSIYGARVTTAGVVFDVGPVVSGGVGLGSPAMARGTGSQVLVAYQGWAGTVGGRPYNSWRIWGKLNPGAGVTGNSKPQAAGHELGATIVRGVLFLPRFPDSSVPSALLDITGCKVLSLRPGANDVRTVAPGVYFVREARAQTQVVTKVVVAR